MSIKEALERGPMEKQRKVMSYLEFRRLSNQRTGELMSSISEEALVRELLSELEGVIKPDYPDVKINGMRTGDGDVALTLAWNFSNPTNGFNKVDINIGAYPWKDESVFL